MDLLLTISNQITVVAFQSVQLAQASFLQKNQMLQNVFLISETLRWHRASVACKIKVFKVDYFDFSCKKFE
jgi:hypothetical protein